jgi:hypothetical protein
MLRACLSAALVLISSIQLHAQFKPRVDYAVGTTPFSVAIGDFNRDGHPDLAVANSAADAATGVSILLGNGDGTFRTHVDYPVGGRPTSIVTYDFNSDGKLDLAIANGTFAAVSILLGNGDGTFQAPVSYATGANAQWLAAADFDGDGKLDLAIANYGSDYSGGSVSVLLGNGDGTFQGQVQYPAGINPFGIMAGDFNHDNKIDLAVVCNNGNYGVWVLLGNGDGTFQMPTYYPSGYNPRVGTIADLNRDGNLDLAIANCISNNVSILLGDGAGHFASQVNYATGSCPQTLSSGDFDGDGTLDLVTANAQNNNVTMLKGNGDGTFQSGVSFSVGTSPMWVAVADLNGDSAPDLIVTNTADNTVSVLLNAGTDFQMAASAPSPATIKRGETATSTISMALLKSYGTPEVNLSCSVQPAQSAPTCSFDPNPLIFNNGLGTATLTLATTTLADRRGSSLPFLWLAVAGLTVMGTGSRSWRKKPVIYLLGVILLGSVVFQSSCGNSSGPVQKSQPQTYTITITGSSGSTQHSATTTLTVN